MSLVIGMYYDNKKGALIASDSRVLDGYKPISSSKKLFCIKEVVLGFTGTVWIRDELVWEIEEKLKTLRSPGVIRRAIQQALIERRTYNTEGESPIIKEKDFSCDCLFGIYSDRPRLFYMDEKGIVEFVNGNEVKCIGQMSEYAQEILEDLHYEGITKEQAIQSTLYIMDEVSRRNLAIDNVVQIATVEKNETQILNYENEKFNFEKFADLRKKIDSEKNFCHSKKGTSYINFWG